MSTREATLLMLSILCMGMVLVSAAPSAAAVINVADWTGMQAAINGASAGDTIQLAAGTYTTTSDITINKAVIVDGGGSTINVSGSGWYVCHITGAGATLQNITINKTDKTGVHNLVLIQGANTTVQGCTFSGQYVLGDGEVSRALEVAYNTTGLLIQNNTFTNLRQPAYFNPGCTGNIINNHVANTRGWVLIGPLTMDFTGNTWSGNAVDIYLNPDVPFGAPYDPIGGLAARNNGANIQDDRAGVNPYPVTNITKWTSHATIQAAINAADPGDTIQCIAGTYAGMNTINKPLTLQGPNAGVHGADAGRAAEAILPASYYAFSPAASDITIDGFRFQGTSNRVIDTYANADNLTIANCVFATTGGATTGTIQMGGGSHDDMVVECNLFDGVANGQCIYLGGTHGDLLVDDNKFDDCGTGLFQAGTVTNPTISNNEFVQCVTGVNMGSMTNPTITDNTFTDMVYVGLQIGTAGGTVSGNTFDGASGYDFGGGVTAAYAIQLWGGAWGTWTCENIDVSNNEISDYPNPDAADFHVGIYLPADVGPNANIHGNTMTNCGIGIRVRSSQDNTIQDNTIAGTGTCGILVTDSTAPTTLDIGSTSIAAGLTEFIQITNGATLDIDATSATFQGAADDAAKEAKVWHDVDEAGVGHVDWGQGGATATNLSVQNVSGAKGATVQLAARLTAGGAALAGQTVNISVEGTLVGSPVTDSNGWARINYTITQDAGAFDIDAAFGGVFNYQAAAGTGTLTVTTPAPTSITVTMAPNPVDAGATSTATVTGSNGVDYSAVATCYIQYGAGGSWAGNVYTSAKAGTWTVTAVYGSLAATDTLTVNHGAVATVTLSPANASITTDQTQTYTAQATDAQGNSWTPNISSVQWDGHGSVSWGFPPLDRVVYQPTAADGGTTVWIEVQVDNAPVWSNRAYLDVTSSGSGGTPLILAWDRDTATFYLCTDAANPQTGTALAMGNNTVGGITVTVAKTGSSSTDLVATVTNAGAPGNSLRVRWYLRSGAVDKCYSYSTISGVTHTAVYSLGRTSVDGGRSQVGFFGLAHNLNADPPTAITYSVVQQ